jgi:hypothetical protein
MLSRAACVARQSNLDDVSVLPMAACGHDLPRKDLLRQMKLCFFMGDKLLVIRRWALDSIPWNILKLLSHPLRKTRCAGT